MGFSGLHESALSAFFHFWKNVDLFGYVVVAAQDKDRNIWAGVSYFCKALGMNSIQKDTQVDKIKKDKTLNKGHRKFPGGIFGAANLQQGYSLHRMKQLA